MSSRIGKGPWARALGSVLVPDDSTPEAIRGEELWRQGAVEDLSIETGQITARVDGCTVTITAPTIPPRIWDALARYAQNRGALQQAVRGEVQSVQLEHLLAQDWEERLVPDVHSTVVACSCDDDGTCVHRAAFAYAIATEIDAAPVQLLRWRVRREATSQFVAPNPAHWIGGDVTPDLGKHIRPAESALRRLGDSGIRVGNEDVSDVLALAYEVFRSRRA